MQHVGRPARIIFAGAACRSDSNLVVRATPDDPISQNTGAAATASENQTARVALRAIRWLGQHLMIDQLDQALNTLGGSIRATRQKNHPRPGAVPHGPSCELVAEHVLYWGSTDGGPRDSDVEAPPDGQFRELDTRHFPRWSTATAGEATLVPTATSDARSRNLGMDHYR